VIIVLLVAVIIGVVAFFAWSEIKADPPYQARHEHRPPPAPEPPGPVAPGRLPMLPEEPADWWDTPDAAAELLAALKDEDTPQPTFTAAELDETWTDLPPVTVVGPIVRDRADLIARYLP
jgi:hypothetical protein